MKSLLNLLLGVSLFMGASSFAQEAEVPAPLIITVEKNNTQTNYSFGNNRMLEERYQKLEPKEKENFQRVRAKYLQAVAGVVSQKSIGWVLSRPDWLEHQRNNPGDTFFNEEDTMAYRVKRQKILGGIWGTDPMRERQRLAIEKYLQEVDALIWEDVENVSKFEQAGLVVILQAQTGAVVGKYGFFYGGGFALDAVANEKTGKTEFTLHLHGEKNRPDPTKNISFGVSILNIKVSAGFQNGTSFTGNPIKSGHGWTVLGTPLYLLYKGDRVAALGGAAADLGVLSILSTLGAHHLGPIGHLLPVIPKVLHSMSKVWGFLPQKLVERSAPLLGFLHSFSTIQTNWKEYRLMSFTVDGQGAKKQKIKIGVDSPFLPNPGSLTCLNLLSSYNWKNWSKLKY